MFCLSSDMKGGFVVFLTGWRVSWAKKLIWCATGSASELSPPSSHTTTGSPVSVIIVHRNCLLMEFKIMIFLSVCVLTGQSHFNAVKSWYSCLSKKLVYFGTLEMCCTGSFKVSHYSKLKIVTEIWGWLMPVYIKYKEQWMCFCYNYIISCGCFMKEHLMWSLKDD